MSDSADRGSPSAPAEAEVVVVTQGGEGEEQGGTLEASDERGGGEESPRDVAEGAEGEGVPISTPALVHHTTSKAVIHDTYTAEDHRGGGSVRGACCVAAAPVCMKIK